jgi:hypothetical protein
VTTSTTPPPVIDFDEPEHLYVVNGILRPSVTQILERAGLVDFSHIPKNIRLAALSRGRRVHKAAQFLVEDDLDMDTVAIEERGYVESCAQFLATSEFVILGSERRVASLRYGYAGTVDAFGLWRGFAIADWCTGDLWESAKDLQTSGYMGALREHPPGEWTNFTPASPIQRIGVHLNKYGRLPHTEPYADPMDFSKFLAAVTVVHEQLRRGKKGKVAA